MTAFLDRLLHHRHELNIRRENWDVPESQSRVPLTDKSVTIR